MTSMKFNQSENNNCIIIAILKSEPMGHPINRKSRLHLLISSLPVSATKMHVESLCKPHDSTSIFIALPGKFDFIKRHSPSILSLSNCLLPLCVEVHV